MLFPVELVVTDTIKFLMSRLFFCKMYKFRCAKIRVPTEKTISIPPCHTRNCIFFPQRAAIHLAYNKVTVIVIFFIIHYYASICTGVHCKDNAFLIYKNLYTVILSNLYKNRLCCRNLYVFCRNLQKNSLDKAREFYELIKFLPMHP